MKKKNLRLEYTVTFDVFAEDFNLAEDICNEALDKINSYGITNKEFNLQDAIKLDDYDFD